MFSLTSLGLPWLSKRTGPTLAKLLEEEREAVFMSELKALEEYERARYTVLMLRERRTRLTATLTRINANTLHTGTEPL